MSQSKKIAPRPAKAGGAPVPPSIRKVAPGGWAWLTDGAVALLLFGVTFLCFWPALQNGFLEWDDSGMFTTNLAYRGLGWANLKWMFTTFHYAHYHPVTWLTLGLDYVRYGMDPRGYHQTSLLIHSANAVLACVLIRQFLRLAWPQPAVPAAFRWCAAVGALVYALHPLRVESVAWATERRDVLSGFFYLLTLITYLHAQTTPGKRGRWLAVAWVCFVLSFLSKAWGIMLPVALLLLDFFPLRRMERAGEKNPWGKLLREKVPFVLVSVGLAVVAYRGQAQWGIEHENLTLLKRMAISAYGVCFYLGKTLWPLHLSPLYGLPPDLNPLSLKYLACGASGLGVTVLLWWKRQRWPWAFVAWIAYGVIVAPVIGFTQKGDQIAADRYTYLCLLPVPVLVAGGLYWLTEKWRRARVPLWIISVILLPALLLGGLGALTWRQTKIWHDEFSLWQAALDLEPDNAVARNGRGRILMLRGETQPALADFNHALKFNPKLVSARNNRGMILYGQGDYDGALADFNAAIAIRAQAETCNNRGAVHEVKGDLNGAMADYKLALQIDPQFANAHYNLGRLHKNRGELAEAIESFAKAIYFQADHLDARQQRGNALLEKGELDAAEQDYRQVLQLAGPNWSQRTAVEQRLRQIQSRRAGAPKE